MRKRGFSYSLLTIAIMVNYSPSIFASPSTANQNTLSEIIVYGSHNQSLSSVSSINKEEIKKLPNANENITDYLQSNPNVRYENSDKNGLMRGEIKPEDISINGADANQTAYFVDNVNVNNDLAVDSEVFDGAMQVIPGLSSTQAYFFNANLLSKVDVHDHNISASLGGFMGGAVVAKTKQYSGKNGVSLSYRTTNSAWNKINEDANAHQILKLVRPTEDGAANLQPKYNKQTFSLMAETGLTDNLGMVFGFNRRASRIEQYRLIGYSDQATLKKEDHTRLSDNILLNLNWAINQANRLELSTRYSNYKEEKYYPNNYNNNIDDYHKAYGTTLAWVHSFDSSIWTNTLAYDLFKDKRKSNSSNVDIVNVYDENFDPLYDYEQGGYGNSQLIQKNIHYSTELAIDPFKVGNAEHSLSLGGIYQATQYKFNRDKDVNGKVSMFMDGMLMPLETLFTPKGKAKTTYQNYVLYGEDLINWNQFEMRPGLRIERDDYLKNNNIAPRFVAKYMPWDNSAISLGLNRYYGRSFSSLKLTNEILKLNRDTSNIRDFQETKKLKTPYSDELSLTLEQDYKNLAFKLGYIHRNNKDRIILKRKQIGMKPNGDPEYAKYYANGNNFGVDVYTLQVNNITPWQLGNTYWDTTLGFDWLNTKKADLTHDYDLNEIVYLDGKRMNRMEMQRKVNSNKEDWIARLGINMSIPNYDLSWSNKIFIKAPIKGYETIGNEYPDDIERYRTYNYGKHVQWDTRLRWQPTLANRHKPYVQIDILNILNQTRKIKSIKPISTHTEYSIYTPGRELWLEVGYEF